MNNFRNKLTMREVFESPDWKITNVKIRKVGESIRWTQVDAVRIVPEEGKPNRFCGSASNTYVYALAKEHMGLTLNKLLKKFQK